MPKSNFLRDALLDHQLGGPDFTRPATVYFALYTVAPTSAGGGTEVSGNNYSRVGVLNNLTNFPAASGGLKSNGTSITFPTPSAGGWGLVLAFGIFDALTGGNFLRFGALTVPKTLDQDDEVVFQPGDLDCTEA